MQIDWLWELFLPNHPAPPPQPGLTISRKFSLTINTVQLHSFRLLVKTSCLLAENMNGTPVHDVNRHVLFGRGSALIWYHIDVIVISLLLYGQLSCHPQVLVSVFKRSIIVAKCITVQLNDKIEDNYT